MNSPSAPGAETPTQAASADLSERMLACHRKSERAEARKTPEQRDAEAAANRVAIHRAAALGKRLCAGQARAAGDTEGADYFTAGANRSARNVQLAARKLPPKAGPARRPRPRGAGRPARRAATRSSARSGDSGEPGPGDGPGDDSVLARPVRAARLVIGGGR